MSDPTRDIITTITIEAGDGVSPLTMKDLQDFIYTFEHTSAAEDDQLKPTVRPNTDGNLMTIFVELPGLKSG